MYTVFIDVKIKIIEVLSFFSIIILMIKVEIIKTFCNLGLLSLGIAVKQ